MTKKYRNPMKRLLILFPVLLQLAAASICVSEQTSTDVCVYGGTASGVVTAVQVARMGKSIVLIEPGQTIGGMTSGSLGNTDIGKQASIGGVTREFYQSIRDWYQEPAHWKFQSKDEYEWKGDRVTDDAWFVFEPHVALLKLDEMLEEAKVPVVYGERIDLNNGVIKEGANIVGVRMESGREFGAKVFIDCTYEGDLMAKAGVSYTIGREPNSQHGESINGFQATELSRRGPKPLDPYVINGDPKSGMIKGLQADVVGKNGDGDKRVQAYNYRLCLTSVTENRVPFEKPEGYDESEFELLFRWLEAGNTRNVPLGSNPIPNRKTDTNKAGWISTDYIGMCDDYPDADYQKRKEITDAHIRYHKGLLWTLANHPRVPEAVRRRSAKLGFAKDEFVDNGHFPHQLYVREGRGMLEPARDNLHLRLPQRLWIHPYGAGLHDARAGVRDSGRAGHQRRSIRSRFSLRGTEPAARQRRTDLGDWQMSLLTVNTKTTGWKPIPHQIPPCMTP